MGKYNGAGQEQRCLYSTTARCENENHMGGVRATNTLRHQYNVIVGHCRGHHKWCWLAMTSQWTLLWRLFNGYDSSPKINLWYESKNSWLWDETTIPHLAILDLRFHPAFGLAESQHQNYLIEYDGFIQQPLVPAIFLTGPYYRQCWPEEAQQQGQVGNVGWNYS